jgi:hypothetical protein
MPGIPEGDEEEIRNHTDIIFSVISPTNEGKIVDTPLAISVDTSDGCKYGIRSTISGNPAVTHYIQCVPPNTSLVRITLNRNQSWMNFKKEYCMQKRKDLGQNYSCQTLESKRRNVLHSLQGELC